MTKLLVNGQHVLYCPALASKIGRSAATILQQANYWMSVKGGKTIDGIKWFWKTYEQWAEELSLSVSTVRRAIAVLKTLGFIAVERLSAKTYYQANWYTVNKDAVKDFLNEHIDISITKVSTYSQSTHQIKEFTSKEFASQQHCAVELKKGDEAEPEIGEQAPVTHYVDDLDTDYSTNETDCLEGHSSAPAGDVQKPSDAIVSDPVQATRYVSESEQVNSSTEKGISEGHSSALAGDVQKPSDAIVSKSVSVDEPQADYDVAADPVKTSIQPSQQEVQEVLQQLREIPCTPQFRLNSEIQRTVRRCWENVPGAIAYLKEALRTWKGVKSPEAVFVAACKEGRKPESAQVKSAVKAWFEWARKQRIVLAMSGEVVYTADGEAVVVGEMMRRFPMREWHYK